MGVLAKVNIVEPVRTEEADADSNGSACENERSDDKETSSTGITTAATVATHSSKEQKLGLKLSK